MKKVTIALDDELLARAEEYAHRHGTTMTGLIRTLLQNVVSPATTNWPEDCFAKMDAAAELFRKVAIESTSITRFGEVLRLVYQASAQYTISLRVVLMATP